MTAALHAARIHATRVHEIPNGVDLTRFRPPHDAGEVQGLRARLGLPADHPLVVFVGFFSRDKAPDVLLAAWKRLPDALRPALLFIGSTDAGHLEVDATLVREARAAAASDPRQRIRFLESTPEIEDYLRAADVLAAPSRREGLSNAVLEALASGLPVVACRIPGVTDYAIGDHATGLLTPAGDVAAVAAALAELLTDEDRRRRMRAEARRRAESRFDIRQVAARHLAVYRDLAS